MLCRSVKRRKISDREGERERERQKSGERRRRILESVELEECALSFHALCATAMK